MERKVEQGRWTEQRAGERQGEGVSQWLREGRVYKIPGKRVLARAQTNRRGRQTTGIACAAWAIKASERFHFRFFLLWM